jgi:hypothetical protein
LAGFSLYQLDGTPRAVNRAVGVTGHHLYVRVPERRLNVNDVGAGLDHAAGRGVAQVVKRQPGDAGVLTRQPENLARVANLIIQRGWRQGTQPRIARELGASEATISRDLRKIYTVPERDKMLLQRAVSKTIKGNTNA